VPSRVTVGDHSGISRASASNLTAMDPEGEPDLDAIAKDLAEVEAELDRLADGTYDEDRTPPDPAAR
jgi:hypothetical protein